MPGVPYVFIGRNRNISWGISRAAHSDYEKLFFEHSNGFTSKSGDTDTSTTTIASTSDRGSEGEEGKVTLREEFITVRGQAEPLLHTARDSVHGPLVSDLLTPTLTGSIAQLKLGWTSFALSSPALEQPLSLSFLYKINTASSFEEFASGVEDLTAVALNFVYADSNGNIGSVVSGR